VAEEVNRKLLTLIDVTRD